MQQVMSGQGRTRVPGVQIARTPEGGTNRREPLPAGGPASSALALRPVRVDEPAGASDVVITPDLVADLHDPTLVITHGYVGPERRHADRRSGEWPTTAGSRPSLARRALSVVLLTAAVVVPLTMIAARSVPPATANGAPTPATAPSAPTSPAGAPHRATKVFGATAQQIARAESAYQRALARVGASGAGGPHAGSGTGASGAALVASSDAVSPEPQAAPAAGGAGGTSPAGPGPSAAARQRTAAAAAGAAARAAAQAAAAQRRLANAAARAQARAQRAAARAATGGVGGGDVASGSAGAPGS